LSGQGNCEDVGIEYYKFVPQADDMANAAE
jgi:hypothetical protein